MKENKFMSKVNKLVARRVNKLAKEQGIDKHLIDLRKSSKLGYWTLIDMEKELKKLAQREKELKS